MGAWGTGAFDNDNAADFADGLEFCTTLEARSDLLLATLLDMAAQEVKPGLLDERYEFSGEVESAIAAAAFVADTLNGRQDFTSNPFAMAWDEDGEDQHPIPFAPVSLRLLGAARDALEVVLRQMVADGISEEWQAPSKAILAALQ